MLCWLLIAGVCFSDSSGYGDTSCSGNYVSLNGDAWNVCYNSYDNCRYNSDCRSCSFQTSCGWVSHVSRRRLMFAHPVSRRSQCAAESRCVRNDAGGCSGGLHACCPVAHLPVLPSLVLLSFLGHPASLTSACPSPGPVLDRILHRLPAGCVGLVLINCRACPNAHCAVGCVLLCRQVQFLVRLRWLR
jgi:hypothetical protein